MAASLCKLILFLSLFVLQSSSTNITRGNVPVFTMFGDWGPWEYCPSGQYANAFTARIQKAQGDKDDTGLNAVCLFCSPLGEDYDEAKSKKICSTQGPFGDWLPKPFECPESSLFIGFNLMNEEFQGMSDDTGADNIKMYCSNRKVFETQGSKFGNYGKDQYCLKGQAICGIRTQVEKKQPEGKNKDDTTLNNLDMKCCDIPTPATTCVPSDRWQRVTACDNLGSENNSTCTLEQKIGTTQTQTSKLSGSQRNMVVAAMSAGVDVGVSFGGFGLKASLSGSKEKGKTTGLDWSKENSKTFSDERTTTVSFNVLPRTRTEVYQIIGSCGIYTVRSSRFFRADVKKRGEKVTPKLLPEGFFCDQKSTSDEHLMMSVNNQTMKCKPTSKATILRTVYM